VTRRVASLMNGAYNFIILMYQAAYGYPFFNSMPGRGSVSTVEERRQCIIIVYDSTLEGGGRIMLPALYKLFSLRF